MRSTIAETKTGRTQSIPALSVGAGVAKGLTWMAAAARWWWSGWLEAPRRMGGDPAMVVRQR